MDVFLTTIVKCSCLLINDEFSYFYGPLGFLIYQSSDLVRNFVALFHTHRYMYSVLTTEVKINKIYRVKEGMLVVLPWMSWFCVSPTHLYLNPHYWVVHKIKWGWEFLPVLWHNFTGSTTSYGRNIYFFSVVPFFQFYALAQVLRFRVKWQQNMKERKKSKCKNLKRILIIVESAGTTTARAAAAAGAITWRHEEE